MLIRLRKSLGGGDVAFVLTMVSSLSVQAPISASTSCFDTPAVDWPFSSASAPLGLSCWPFRSASVRGIVVCDSFLPTACFVAASSALLPSIAAPCSKECNSAFREGSCEILIFLGSCLAQTLQYRKKYEDLVSSKVCTYTHTKI